MVPKPNLIKRPNGTRLKPCKICPFIGSDFNRNESHQDDYHRMAMQEIYQSGDLVWTCLYHLNYDKKHSLQCHVGAKELLKVKDFYESK